MRNDATSQSGVLKLQSQTLAGAAGLLGSEVCVLLTTVTEDDPVADFWECSEIFCFPHDKYSQLLQK